MYVVCKFDDFDFSSLKTKLEQHLTPPNKLNQNWKILKSQYNT